MYPPVEDLQEVSIRVASRVIARAVEGGVATSTKLAKTPKGLSVTEAAKAHEPYVRSRFWRPDYLPMRKG